MTMPNDSLPTAPSGEAQTDVREIDVKPYIGRLRQWQTKLCNVALLTDIGDTIDALASLSTERARMERERDEARDHALSAESREAFHRSLGLGALRERDEARAEVSRLTSELDRVRGALEKYGRHDFGCNALKAPGRVCSCGFADATTRREE